MVYAVSDVVSVYDITTFHRPPKLILIINTSWQNILWSVKWRLAAGTSDCQSFLQVIMHCVARLEVFVLVCTWASGSYVVHHFNGRACKELCCAAQTCVVHHRPVLCTYFNFDKLMSYTLVVHSVAFVLIRWWRWLCNLHDKLPPKWCTKWCCQSGCIPCQNVLSI